jgi:hypothetical protein
MGNTGYPKVSFQNPGNLLINNSLKQRGVQETIANNERGELPFLF